MHDSEHEPDATASHPDATDHGDLRGSFVAVLFMAAFFVAAWLTVFAIAMVRR